MMTTRAFALVEILIACALLLMLLTVTLGYAPAIIIHNQIKAEDAALERIADDVVGSFASEDFEVNVAAMPGTLPSGTAPTIFSAGLEYPATTDTSSWFVKVARRRGITATAGASPSATTQPALARILTNVRHRTRYLFSAPGSEPGLQRFLLVSILDDGALTFPDPSSGSAVTQQARFDAIWNFDFDTDAARLPAQWTAELSSAEQAAWLDGPGSGSNLARMRIVRITCPKYTVTVNNAHTSDTGFLTWDGGAHSLAISPGSAPVTTPPILAGRTIVLASGPDAASAVVKFRWSLDKNSTVTLQ